jgi:hypothetical protein
MRCQNPSKMYHSVAWNTFYKGITSSLLLHLPRRHLWADNVWGCRSGYSGKTVTGDKLSFFSIKARLSVVQNCSDNRGDFLELFLSGRLTLACTHSDVDLLFFVLTLPCTLPHLDFLFLPLTLPSLPTSCAASCVVCLLRHSSTQTILMCVSIF